MAAVGTPSWTAVLAAVRPSKVYGFPTNSMDGLTRVQMFWTDADTVKAWVSDASKT